MTDAPPLEGLAERVAAVRAAFTQTELVRLCVHDDMALADRLTAEMDELALFVAFFTGRENYDPRDEWRLLTLLVVQHPLFNIDIEIPG